MDKISSTFIQCPICKQESFEVIRVGNAPATQLAVSHLDRLYESIRQAAYAQCEKCGYESDGHDLIDFLEQFTLEEGE